MGLTVTLSKKARKESARNELMECVRTVPTSILVCSNERFKSNVAVFSVYYIVYSYSASTPNNNRFGQSDPFFCRTSCSSSQTLFTEIKEKFQSHIQENKQGKRKTKKRWRMKLRPITFDERGFFHGNILRIRKKMKKFFFVFQF
jgi:hypothetical protein